MDAALVEASKEKDYAHTMQKKAEASAKLLEGERAER